MRIDFFTDTIHGFPCTAAVPGRTERGTGGAPVVYVLGRSEPKSLDGILSVLGRLGATDFPVLIGISPQSWEHDFSPWAAPALSPQSAAFTGGADDFLRALAGEIMPRMTELAGINADATDAADALDAKHTAIAGYSLGGLCALYAALSGFPAARVASVSGSLWFAGWDNYIEEKIKNGAAAHIQRAYLSLGKKEAASRNPAMARVGACTAHTEELLAAHLGAERVRVEQNPGGHFTDVDTRIARAVAWLAEIDAQK